MNIRLLHKVAELLDTLEKTSGGLGDLSSALQHIAKIACTYFAAHDCVVYAINPITEHFESLISVADSDMSVEWGEIEPLIQQILEERMLVVEKSEHIARYRPLFPGDGHISSFVGLALSMRSHRRPLGVIVLSFDQPRKLAMEDYELLRIFASQAAYVLQETWLLRRYQEVVSIGQEINQDLDTVEALLQKLKRHAAGILDISHTLLLSVYHPQSNTVDIYIEAEGGESIRQSQVELMGATKYVLTEQEDLFIEQMSVEEKNLSFQRAFVPGTKEQEAMIFIPLVLRGISLGVLSIQHPDAFTYTEEDKFILKLLANHTALALYNVRLYNSLKKMNNTGQYLTQQLISGQLLDMTVEQLLKETEADNVILYLYAAGQQQFILPPRTAGHLYDPSVLDSTPLQSRHMTRLVAQRKEPILAHQAEGVYTLIGTDIGQGTFQQREGVRSVAVLPLWVADVLIGVLFVNFRNPQQFDSSQELLITGLAHYAAIAIRNAQELDASTLRRVQELETLQRIDRALNSSLEMDVVLETILRLGQQHVPAEKAAIMLYDATAQLLEVRAALGPYSDLSLKQIVSPDTKGITRWVLKNKIPARVNNVRLDERWRDIHLAVVPDTLSELDVPLLDGENVIGVLNFESSCEAAFKEGDEIFLGTLAGRAVLAIKKAEDYEREKRLVAETRVFYQISKEITKQSDPAPVFDLILRQALQLTNSTLGSLHLYSPHTQMLRIVSEYGALEEKKRLHQGLDEGVIGLVARQRRMATIGDVTLPPWDKIHIPLHPNMRSELAVAMLEGSNLRGVLNVENTRPNHFRERDQRLLKGLADVAVVALQNAERYFKAEKVALSYEWLYEAKVRLDGITDLGQIDQAYGIVAEYVAKHSKCRVVLRRYVDDSEKLVHVLLPGVPVTEPLPPFKLEDGSFYGSVARENRAMKIDDLQNSPFACDFPIKDARSLAATSIRFEDRFYGILDTSHAEVAYFDESDLHIFQRMADQLAGTIHRLEMEKTQQELEQMSSIGQSAFEVTHRLGNDLGLVNFYISDIQEELRKLGVTDQLIEEKLTSILKDVNSVLFFSKALKSKASMLGDKDEAAESAIELSPHLLVDEVMSHNSTIPLTIERRVKVDERIATVRAVHSQVRDVLHNLVENAIQAMPNGGTLSLRAQNAGRFVAFTVTDTGVGMPPKELDKIFNLFHSGKGSSGFGLWSARRYALKNHGDLKVRSKQGEGTTFTLTLPRASSVTL